VNFFTKDVKTFGFRFSEDAKHDEKTQRVKFENSSQLKLKNTDLSRMVLLIKQILLIRNTKENVTTLHIHLEHGFTFQLEDQSFVKIGELLTITKHTTTRPIPWKLETTNDKITWDDLERDQITYMEPYTENTLRTAAPAGKFFESLNFNAQGECIFTFRPYPRKDPEISYTLVFQVTPLETDVTQ